MNKKLFFAGFALLAAVSFTSSNSDNPIDITNPNGVTPAAATHYVGGEYDWTAIAKDYAQLQEFWAADKDAVKKALTDSKANTVNILLDVSGYELKAGDVITLPNFWGVGEDTNGKVVNITFKGNFKNADFERAAVIKDGAAAKNLPVTIDVNTLVRSEVNFTFNVEKFDLDIRSDKARSTLSGDYTIGYMIAAADVAKDALEVKEGTIEGLDLQSTGEFKGTFDGIWTKNGELFTVASNGIKLASGKVANGSKNVYLEANAWVDTWYNANGANKQYKLGTVKFVQKAGTDAYLGLDGLDKDNNFVSQDAIENIVGFNKANCFVRTFGHDKALDNIDAIEKVTVIGYTELKKDIFTDVQFQNFVEFSTKNITSFADVTFGSWLDITIHADNQELSFNGVNFKRPVELVSGITETEVAGVTSKTYQWIIDNSTGDGHFEEVTNAAPLKDANKDKAIMEYLKTDIDYDATTQKFAKTGGTNAQVNEANASYVVTIIDITTSATTFIPEGTTVQLNSCKFNEPATAKYATTNTALNYIWGDKEFWDEQCWYTVYVDGTKYNWKKATNPGGTSTVKFVLVAPAAAE